MRNAARNSHRKHSLVAVLVLHVASNGGFVVWVLLASDRIVVLLRRSGQRVEICIVIDALISKSSRGLATYHTPYYKSSTAFRRPNLWRDTVMSANEASRPIQVQYVPV